MPLADATVVLPPPRMITPPPEVCVVAVRSASVRESSVVLSLIRMPRLPVVAAPELDQ